MNTQACPSDSGCGWEQMFLEGKSLTLDGCKPTKLFITEDCPNGCHRGDTLPQPLKKR